MVRCADPYKGCANFSISTPLPMRKVFWRIFSSNWENFDYCCRRISNKTRIETKW